MDMGGTLDAFTAKKLEEAEAEAEEAALGADDAGTAMSVRGLVSALLGVAELCGWLMHVGGPVVSEQSSSSEARSELSVSLGVDEDGSSMTMCGMPMQDEGAAAGRGQPGPKGSKPSGQKKVRSCDNEEGSVINQGSS